MLAVLADTPEIRFKHDAMMLNSNTAICRVRDAVNAVIKGFVFYEDIDADKLRVRWIKYRVDYDQYSREVLVTQRRLVPVEANAIPAKLEMDIVDIELKVSETTFEEDIIHWAALFGHYRVRGKATIIGVLSPELEQRIRAINNIILTQVKPNEYILS